MINLYLEFNNDSIKTTVMHKKEITEIKKYDLQHSQKEVQAFEQELTEYLLELRKQYKKCTYTFIFHEKYIQTPNVTVNCTKSQLAQAIMTNASEYFNRPVDDLFIRYVFRPINSHLQAVNFFAIQKPLANTITRIIRSNKLKTTGFYSYSNVLLSAARDIAPQIFVYVDEKKTSGTINGIYTVDNDNVFLSAHHTIDFGYQDIPDNEDDIRAKTFASLSKGLDSFYTFCQSRIHQPLRISMCCADNNKRNTLRAQASQDLESSIDIIEFNMLDYFLEHQKTLVNLMPPDEEKIAKQRIRSFRALGIGAILVAGVTIIPNALEYKNTTDANTRLEQNNKNLVSGNDIIDKYGQLPHITDETLELLGACEDNALSIQTFLWELQTLFPTAASIHEISFNAGNFTFMSDVPDIETAALMVSQFQKFTSVEYISTEALATGGAGGYALNIMGQLKTIIPENNQDDVNKRYLETPIGGKTFYEICAD